MVVQCWEYLMLLLATLNKPEFAPELSPTHQTWSWYQPSQLKQHLYWIRIRSRCAKSIWFTVYCLDFGLLLLKIFHPSFSRPDCHPPPEPNTAANDLVSNVVYLSDTWFQTFWRNFEHSLGVQYTSCTLLQFYYINTTADPNIIL